jgi:hypothetical protein
MIRQERKLCQQIERQRKTLSKKCANLQKRVGKLKGSLTKLDESIEKSLLSFTYKEMGANKKLTTSFLANNGFARMHLVYGLPRLSKNNKHFYTYIHANQKSRMNRYGQILTQPFKLPTPKYVLDRLKRMTRMKRELIIKAKEAIRVNSELSELPETI